MPFSLALSAITFTTLEAASIFPLLSDFRSDSEEEAETRTSEPLLVIIGIVFWIGWHVLTNNYENEKLSRLAKKRHGANDHKSNITDW